MLLWFVGSFLFRLGFRFGLQTLLVLVLVFGIGFGWCAWKMERARKQKEVVEWVRGMGGSAHYDYEFNVDGMVTSDPRPKTPPYLRNVLGEDFFSDVVVVSLNGTEVTDEGLGHLKVFTSLEDLHLGKHEVTAKRPLVSDAGLAQLRTLTNLQRLDLDYLNVTDRGLEHLNPLTSLERLDLEHTQVSNDGLKHLNGLGSLEWLAKA
jgi:hypothetical protein